MNTAAVFLTSHIDLIVLFYIWFSCLHHNAASYHLPLSLCVYVCLCVCVCVCVCKERMRVEGERNGGWGASVSESVAVCVMSIIKENILSNLSWYIHMMTLNHILLTCSRASSPPFPPLPSSPFTVHGYECFVFEETWSFRVTETQILFCLSVALRMAVFGWASCYIHLWLDKKLSNVVKKDKMVSVYHFVCLFFLAWLFDNQQPVT